MAILVTPAALWVLLVLTCISVTSFLALFPPLSFGIRLAICVLAATVVIFIYLGIGWLMKPILKRMGKM